MRCFYQSFYRTATHDKPYVVRRNYECCRTLTQIDFLYKEVHPHIFTKVKHDVCVCVCVHTDGGDTTDPHDLVLKNVLEIYIDTHTHVFFYSHTRSYFIHGMVCCCYVCIMID
mmetsp:Transcript_10394/g.18931  ORF Transcript_10394/g.18931 Transcript_10394/m.18931 type:complete len:113 (+) Transcript_10394:503-841(+)